MAPKSQKRNSSNKQKPQDEEREDSLQAVVGFVLARLEKTTHTTVAQILADSYETKFRPFTLERPRVRYDLGTEVMVF